MSKKVGERNNFNFSKGLNTDASIATFPLNYSSDELNFELLPDGTRRRRKGLERIGGSGSDFPPYELVDPTGTQCHQTLKWPNVGGNPNLHFIVVQYSNYLYFYEDVYPISDYKKDFYIDMGNYVASSDFTSSDAGNVFAQIAVGNGYLIVTNKYITPILVEYDADADNISISSIAIRERLLHLLDDGIENNTTQPSSGEYSDTYKFNLLNQGWNDDNIAQYFADVGKYPSRNMSVALGYRRAIDTGFAEADGIKEFSSDKLVAELFGDAPAPMGHLIIDAFNTQTITTSVGAVYNYFTRVNTGSVVSPTGISEIKLNKTGHGLTTGDFIQIPALSFGVAGATLALNFIDYNDGASIVNSFYFNGESYEVTVLDANNFTINVQLPLAFAGLYEDASPASTPAYIYASGQVTTVDVAGEQCKVRPSTCAWFAGRAWYAGIDYKTWTSKIYFSQIIEDTNQLSKCYQAADPTSYNISDLIASDGGVFNIPEAGTIHRLLPFSSSLLVFADNGVWQIGPGDKGYFTADSYSLRKITDAGVYGPNSIVIADNIPIYWGKSSIWRIVTDLRQGFLVAENISVNTIDSYFQNIHLDSKQTVSSVYDDLKKRIIWLYGESDVNAINMRNKVLVYDLKFQSFTPWEIAMQDEIYPVSIFCHRNTDYSEDDNKIIIICLSTYSYIAPNVASGCFKFSNITDFKDLDISALGGSWASSTGGAPSAYLITGYDTAGEPDKYKYAPKISVFMKKTETGYEASSVIGESSLTMQARWDWADNTIAGKWGTAQECYRHLREYIPASPAEAYEDGKPLVITRNKVRGRGRALHLKFAAGTSKNAHLVGWSIKFNTLTDN